MGYHQFCSLNGIDGCTPGDNQKRHYPLPTISEMEYKRFEKMTVSMKLDTDYQAYAIGASPPGPGNISSSFLSTSSSS